MRHIRLKSVCCLVLCGLLVAGWLRLDDDVEPISAGAAPERLLVELDQDTVPSDLQHLGDWASLIPGGTLYTLVKPATVAEDAARLLGAHPRVRRVETDRPVDLLEITPDDPFFAGHPDPYWEGRNQENLQQLNLPEAWEYSTGTPASVIAVVDTGIDYTHPELVRRLYYSAAETAHLTIDPEAATIEIMQILDINENGAMDCADLLAEENAGVVMNGVDEDANGYVDDVCGWDFADGDNDPYDTQGHGTAVSSIIAAESNNALGMTGVCWTCRVMPLRIFATDGFASYGYILSASYYAANNGADIVNYSIATANDSALLADYIRDLYLEHDLILVAAAGNENADVNEILPAAVPEVITVSALGTDGLYKTNYSNYGDAVDLAAPGNAIAVRAAAVAAHPDDPPLIDSEDYYRVVEGTSFSAPHVSGLAGLMLAHRPELRNRHVAQLLTQTAVDTYAPGFDIYTGYGIPDAAAAMAHEPDTDAPLAELIDPPTYLINRNALSLTVGGDHVVAYKYALDDAPWSTDEIPVGIGLTLNLAEGQHTFRLVGRDTSGNWQNTETATTYVWFVDTIPPARTSGLAVSRRTGDEIHLTWTAVANATGYQVRYHTAPITWENFTQATIAPNPPLQPRPAGETESMKITGLEQLTRYYFALVSGDHAGNISPLSNVAWAYTNANGNPVLVKGSGSGVYLLQRAVAKPFLSAETFRALHYDWAAIKTIPDNMLSLFDVGEPMRFEPTDGQIVQPAGDATVYRLENGILRPFRIGADFLAAGHRWRDIIPIDAVTRDRYPTGAPL